jgi:hypothetical protein
MNDMDRLDPKTERAVTDWLHDERDRVPDGLADAALTRSRTEPQRPTWAASLHQRSGLQLSQSLVTGATVAAALGVVAVVLFMSMGHDASNSGTRPTSPPPPPSTIALDADATALGSGFGSLWVGDDDHRLLRIDPADGSVVATIELDGVPCGPIAPAATSLWLATCGVGGTTAYAHTTRVDPETNAVVNTYADNEGDGIGVSAMNGLVWFISDVDPGVITGVDAVTGEKVRDLTTDGPIRDLTAGFGSLWVSPIGRPVVQRIDPESGDVLAEIPLSGDAGYLTVGVDSIWVAEPHQWLVGRIDPTTDRVAAELMAAPGADHIEVAPDGTVWALTGEELFAFDASSNSELHRLPVPAHSAFDDILTHVLTVNGDDVWFADKSSLEKIRPDD